MPPAGIPGPGRGPILVRNPAIVSPLAVHSSGRYFVDSGTGNPVRIKCDAAWIMGCHSASVDDQEYYMDRLVGYGFNAFILMNIVHAGGPSWSNINEPNDAANVAPFNTPNDFSTANPTYFAKVASIIERARKRGLYVAFFHTYAGFQAGNDGWEQVYAVNSNSVNFNWGVFLGNTFPHPNIYWMHGGDHSQSGGALTGLQQIVAGIQSVTRNRIAGSEWTGAGALDTDSLTTSQSGFTYGRDPRTSDMQMQSIYGVGPSNNGLPYTTVDAAYQASPTMPVLLEEPDYYNVGNHPTRDNVRREQHWALTSGSIGGTNSGNTGRWDWVQANWLATLTNVATLDQAYHHALYDSFSWWLLRPSGTATGYCGRLLVTSTNTADSTWISSSMTSDGNVIVVYFPPTGTGGVTATIDLRSMSGTGTYYWYNVTTGRYCNNSGAPGSIGTFGNSSTQSFTTPGDNGTGTNDWVLVGKVPS